MDLDELLRCLAEAEKGELRPELCDRRYVVVEYGEMDLDDEEEDGDGEYEDDEDDEGFGFGSIGMASSFYEALDVLGGALQHEEWLEETEDDYAASLEDDAEDDEEQGGDERRVDQGILRGIRTPERRALALMLDGWMGPMDLVTEDFEEDAYLGRAAERHPGARFVMLASAAPPHQEVAWAILELQPAVEPGETDRALLTASATGDPAAVAAALAHGADVNALDEQGRTPLHHAVARRSAEVVAALLAAGANPGSQSGYGSAPQFAAPPSARRGRRHPTAERLEGPEHWHVIRLLLDAGADVNAADTAGRTLLDLAIGTDPYPADEVRELLARGAVSRDLANTRVDALVRSLPYGSERELRALLNRVRFLLETGAPYDHPLDALLAMTGYYERELSGDYLAEMVDLMLGHGVRDAPGTYGRTALAHARGWVEHGLTHYQQTVDRLTAAAATGPNSREATTSSAKR